METNDLRIPLSSWQFQLDQEDLGEKDGWYQTNFNKQAWTAVKAPGAWDFYDKALWGYEGIAWYFTTVPDLDKADGKFYELLFHGVGGNAKVWINGVLSGENHIRYLPFGIPIPHEFCGEELQITIRIDNRSCEKSLPGTNKIEWILYGGLIQPVEVIQSSNVKISRILIDTSICKNDGIINISAELSNRAATPFHGTVKFSIGEQKTVLAANCEPGETIPLKSKLTIKNAQKWDIANPFLYLLETQVQTDTDLLYTASERFGIREIHCEGNKVFLNGNEIFFKGVCRYDEYEGYGPTVPEDVIRKDLQHIKECGMNFIRVHYPQAPIHYQIADEIGLFYMHDVPICWWRPSADEHIDLYHPLLKESMQAVDRMANLYYNHPSWIIWSMSNESNTHVPTGNVMMKSLMERAKKQGGNRLMTWVCDHRPLKGEFDGADLIAVNLYYGIHHGDRADYIHQFDSLIAQPTHEYLSLLAEDYPDIPILIAEFGAVGVRGMNGNSRLTEDFQAAFIQCTWNAIMSSKNICGTILWSWADYYHRKDFFAEGNHINTPFGPYGIVTVDRKIKTKPYNMVRQLFSTKEKS